MVEKEKEVQLLSTVLMARCFKYLQNVIWNSMPLPCCPNTTGSFNATQKIAFIDLSLSPCRSVCSSYNLQQLTLEFLLHNYPTCELCTCVHT